MYVSMLFMILLVFMIALKLSSCYVFLQECKGPTIQQRQSSNCLLFPLNNTNCAKDEPKNMETTGNI
ncbi:hypothetical protein O6H91_13G070900 [Diphasiastrum complanatum]|uniref:Uncharacterized protein n=1 Tax=Diphasiastrum complanatum TaxID=34168 RepID=A0ACC2BW08_DIPCM|nr:hypothetical protein O6H91_13G070900 [Diphasiastrum complanatum]